MDKIKFARLALVCNKQGKKSKLLPEPDERAHRLDTACEPCMYLNFIASFDRVGLTDKHCERNITRYFFLILILSGVL
jgi:hypothetical protein